MTDPVAKKIKQRSDEGDYTLVAPLDYLILGELPDEGETVLGLYPKGSTAQEVANGPVKNALSTPATSMRLRMMAIQGLTSHRRGVGNGGKKVWQRTQLGRNLYEEWKEKSVSISK